MQDINDPVNEALELADAVISTHIESQRPDHIESELKRSLRVKNLHRLAYRSQPAPSNMQALDYFLEVYLEEEDISYDLLFRTSWAILPKADLYQLLNATTSHGPHFLTRLDAAACSNPLDWPHCVQDAVALIDRLIHGLEDAQDSLWIQNASVDFRFRVLNCCTYSFVQRLMFYKARYQGNKSRSQIDEDFEQARYNLHNPPEFDFNKETAELHELVRNELPQVQEAFDENVQLERVGQPIPVGSVSTPIADPEGVRCIVCYWQLTPPGVLTNPCQHAFCRDCLETWIHACEKASYTCSYCRTELFPKPEYRLKESELARNYQQELAELESWDNRLILLYYSGNWFEEEMNLQSLFQQETANQRAGGQPA